MVYNTDMKLSETFERSYQAFIGKDPNRRKALYNFTVQLAFEMLKAADSDPSDHPQGFVTFVTQLFQGESPELQTQTLEEFFKLIVLAHKELIPIYYPGKTDRLRKASSHFSQFKQDVQDLLIGN